jgi:hypothetical protein
MKQLITSLLLGILVFTTGCTKEEAAKADGRLLGLELSFQHKDPKSGETLTNVFSNYYRKTDQVEVNLESSLEIEKIDIVNSVTHSKLTTLDVNGTTASYSVPVNDLAIPFGQRASLFFHVYFKDAGKDGFSYPSMKSYTFNVISEIPSIVNFKRADGSTTELKTTDFNIQGFSEDNKRGVVATFKPGTPSYLAIEDSPLLQFGSSKNFSVSFWMQSNHNTSDPAILGTMDWNSSNNKGWIVAWLNGNLRVVTSDGAGLKNDIRMSSGSLLGDDWHFVTIVFNRTTSLSIYVDGALAVTGAAVPMDLNNGTTVKINQDGTGSYGDRLGSKFGSVIFYEKALTEAEILDIYNSTK